MDGTGTETLQVARSLSEPPFRKVPFSTIREVAEYGMRRRDTIALWFGESDLHTPEQVKAAACASIARGETFYAPNAGIAELREALARYQNEIYGSAHASNEIVVVNSGITGLNIALQLCLQAGDEVVVVEPVWPNIFLVPTLFGASVRCFPLERIGGRYVLDIDRLFAGTTSQTRVLIVNSPNNPTGWTLSDTEVAHIVELASKRGIWIVSDEVYSRLTHFSLAAPSFLPYIENYERLIVLNSFSKAWAMTGWRLGWLTLPSRMAKSAGRLVELSFSCSPVFVQRAGLAALEHSESFIQKSIERYRASLAVAVQALSRFSFASFVEPTASFYLFVRIAGLEDSIQASKRLIDRIGVGFAPGDAFGNSGKGHLRVCCGVHPDRMQEAMARTANLFRSEGLDSFSSARFP
jgi:aspartate aminotransferase